jgi:tryptophan 2,3-dioxygenase
LLEEFERKYKKMFDHMKEYKSNIWQNSSNYQMAENPELIKAMRHFDHTVNITWVMQHLNVIKYIEHSGKGTERRPEEVIGKIHAP